VIEDGSGRGARAGAAPANKRGPALGAVGLSFEKMQLVRQKKEEIEKVSKGIMSTSRRLPCLSLPYGDETPVAQCATST